VGLNDVASERARRALAAYVRQGQTEPAIYRPARDELPARTLDVLVDRNPGETIQQGRAVGFRVTALNDELLGIPSNPLLSDLGADRIDLAERIGGTAVSRSIQQLAEHDADWVTLDVI